MRPLILNRTRDVGAWLASLGRAKLLALCFVVLLLVLIIQSVAGLGGFRPRSFEDLLEMNGSAPSRRGPGGDEYGRTSEVRRPGGPRRYTSGFGAREAAPTAPLSVYPARGDSDGGEDVAPRSGSPEPEPAGRQVRPDETRSERPEAPAPAGTDGARVAPNRSAEREAPAPFEDEPRREGRNGDANDAEATPQPGREAEEEPLNGPADEEREPPGPGLPESSELPQQPQPPNGDAEGWAAAPPESR